MKSIIWDVVMFAGVLCVLIGGVAIILGYSITTETKVTLGMIGIFLIGAGSYGRAKKNIRHLHKKTTRN